jgi:hypothetical protein
LAGLNPAHNRQARINVRQDIDQAIRLRPDYQDRQSSTSQVLLVLDALVNRQEKFVASALGERKKASILLAANPASGTV